MSDDRLAHHSLTFLSDTSRFGLMISLTEAGTGTSGGTELAVNGWQALLTRDIYGNF